MCGSWIFVPRSVCVSVNKAVARQRQSKPVNYTGRGQLFFPMKKEDSAVCICYVLGHAQLCLCSILRTHRTNNISNLWPMKEGGSSCGVERIDCTIPFPRWFSLCWFWHTGSCDPRLTWETRQTPAVSPAGRSTRRQWVGHTILWDNCGKEHHLVCMWWAKVQYQQQHYHFPRLLL